MLNKIMDKFIEERAKFMNNLTIELLNKVGLKVDSTYSNFDMVVVMNELKDMGYRLHIKDGINQTAILGLWKIGDLHEDLVYGYSIEVRLTDNEVKIIAMPIE